MLGFVKNLLGTNANPIGIDFGSESLKMAQVQLVDKEYRLVAAASADVPSHVRHDPNGRMNFFVETVRDLLVQGGFKGRQAVLALPAASMFIQHLRMARMDEEATTKALPWEARGKLPIDPLRAVLRHMVAGEVYQDQEAKNEIIVFAASRDMVNQFLATAARAKLDVVGMNVEVAATVDCFRHAYRRKIDETMTNLFVDIGCSGSRAFVASGAQVLFARAIPVGGEHFARAVAGAMKMKLEDAKLLRSRTAEQQAPAREPESKREVAAEPSGPEGFALLGAGMKAAEGREANPVDAGSVAPAAPSDSSEQMQRLEAASREPLAKLVEELGLCRRYYEATFPSKPVDRIVFVGGEAKHRWLCQQIAQEMGLAAHVGDPLLRMARTSEVGTESGIDRRQPQPNWAVALGLSLGPRREAPTAAEAA